ncbi:hypothetical protein [Cryobacterium sp. Hh38]|nr:hypothetical protein [Cryobacterium sp. Hh38]
MEQKEIAPEDSQERFLVEAVCARGCDGDSAGKADKLKVLSVSWLVGLF